MSDNDIVRLNVSLPRLLNDDLHKHIPWGSKNNIIITLLAEMSRCLDEGGRAAYVDILEGKFEIVCTGIAKRDK